MSTALFNLVRLGSARQQHGCKLFCKTLSTVAPPLAQQASSSSAASTSTPSSSSPNLKQWGPPQTPGQYFSHLQRYTDKRKMALGDLRKLLDMCKTPEQVKYAIQAQELFQRRGQDFSEEVNSHFIKACIRGSNPEAAANVLIKESNRMGAWSTATSLSALVNELSSEPIAGNEPTSPATTDTPDSSKSEKQTPKGKEAAGKEKKSEKKNDKNDVILKGTGLITELYRVSAGKGVHITLDLTSAFLKKCAQDVESQKKILSIANKVLKEDEVRQLASQFSL